MSSTETPPLAGKGFCRNCGKPLTPETWREVQGTFYCPDCLAGFVQHGQAAAHPGKAALAGFIGIVPGLGAIYNGDFLKGAIHVVIFGLIISMISTDHAPGLFIPMLVAWILYMPFEAYQTAKAKLEGTKPAGVIDFSGGRHQTGPVVLIVMGVLFLLNQYDLIDLDRIANLWPLGMIGLGLWMLMKRRGPTNG